MKLNEPVKHGLRGQYPWQQVKHAKLRSDQLQNEPSKNEI